jgi:hypothetical protein
VIGFVPVHKKQGVPSDWSAGFTGIADSISGTSPSLSLNPSHPDMAERNTAQEMQRQSQTNKHPHPNNQNMQTRSWDATKLLDIRVVLCCLVWCWSRRFYYGLDLDYLDSTFFYLVSTWIIWIRLGLFGFDLDYLDPTWSQLGLFGFDLDYLDSTILWLGLNLDYLDPTWSQLGLFGFDLDYLDSTILWLGLDLDYLDSTWIIWIRRFLPCSQLGLFGFDLDYLDSTWIIWIRPALFC